MDGKRWQGLGNGGAVIAGAARDGAPQGLIFGAAFSRLFSPAWPWAAATMNEPRGGIAPLAPNDAAAADGQRGAAALLAAAAADGTTTTAATTNGPSSGTGSFFFPTAAAASEAQRHQKLSPPHDDSFPLSPAVSGTNPAGAGTSSEGADSSLLQKTSATARRPPAFVSLPDSAPAAASFVQEKALSLVGFRHSAHISPSPRRRRKGSRSAHPQTTAPPEQHRSTRRRTVREDRRPAAVKRPSPSSERFPAA